MNRVLNLQPLSLAVGLVFGVVCFLSMGQASTITPSTLGSTVRVEYLPHPRDMVQIHEGSAYTVPPGRVLVLTALGSSNQSGAAILAVNGTPEVRAQCQWMHNEPSYPAITSFGHGVSMKPLPPGLTVSAGSVADVSGGDSSPDDARAWGYLAPQ